MEGEKFRPIEPRSISWETLGAEGLGEASRHSLVVVGCGEFFLVLGGFVYASVWIQLVSLQNAPLTYCTGSRRSQISQTAFKYIIIEHTNTFYAKKLTSVNDTKALTIRSDPFSFPSASISAFKL